MLSFIIWIFDSTLCLGDFQFGAIIIMLLSTFWHTDAGASARLPLRCTPKRGIAGSGMAGSCRAAFQRVIWLPLPPAWGKTPHRFIFLPTLKVVRFYNFCQSDMGSGILLCFQSISLTNNEIEPCFIYWLSVFFVFFSHLKVTLKSYAHFSWGLFAFIPLIYRNFLHILDTFLVV